MIAGLRISNEDFQNLQSIVSELSQTNIPDLKLNRAYSKEREYKIAVDGHPILSDSTGLNTK